MTATAPAAPAKVYFTNLRTHARESQLDKLKRLIRHAGIAQIDFENKFVAIKIHFGELGNLSFLRPNYARAVADVVKELGGKPFLTDCNTLYVGSRKHALAPQKLHDESVEVFRARADHDLSRLDADAA